MSAPTIEAPSKEDTGTMSLNFEGELGVDERDWGAVTILLSEFERELSERRSSLVFRVSVWKMAVRVLKRAETAKLVVKSPSERDHSHHRAILSYLKGAGHIILLELRKHSQLDDIERHIGLTLRDFDAMVADLEYAEREWYGDMKPAMRDDILGNVFGERKRSDH